MVNLFGIRDLTLIVIPHRSLLTFSAQHHIGEYGGGWIKKIQFKMCLHNVSMISKEPTKTQLNFNTWYEPSSSSQS